MQICTVLLSINRVENAWYSTRLKYFQDLLLEQVISINDAHSYSTVDRGLRKWCIMIITVLYYMHKQQIVFDTIGIQPIGVQ